MQPNDFVFNQIYKGALNQGAKEDSAHRFAVIGLDKFKKGKYGGAKVSHLIEQCIKDAKRESK